MDQRESKELLTEVLDEVRGLKLILLGDNKDLGMIAEHRIMWRVHVTLLCIASGGLGIIGTIAIQRLFH